MTVEFLNEKAKSFGIQLADAQIGQKVHYFGVKIYIDELLYCLYRKPQHVQIATALRSPRYTADNKQELSRGYRLETVEGPPRLDQVYNEERLTELEPKAVARAMNWKSTLVSSDRVGQTSSGNNRESLVFTAQNLRTDTWQCWNGYETIFRGTCGSYSH